MFRQDISAIEYGFDHNGEPKASIHFTYASHSGFKRVFFAGMEISRTHHLVSIESKNGNDVIRHFDLTHESRDNVHLLNQVDCALGDDHLNPLKFNYGSNGHLPSQSDSLHLVDSVYLTSFFSQTDIDIINTRGKFVKGWYDDGVLIYPKFDNYAVRQRRLGLLGWHYQYGSGFPSDQKILFAPNTRGVAIVDNSLVTGDGFQTIAPADIDGDGADEIVRVNYGESTSAGDSLKVSVYKNNSSGTPVLQSISSYILNGVITDGNLNSPYQRQFFWGDFDGTGRVQLLALSYNKNIFNVNQSSYAALIDVYNGTLRSDSILFPFTLDDSGRVFAVDFDGDSRTELCRITTSGLQIYRLENNGYFSLDKTLTNNDLYDSSSLYYITDLNGDGYQDIMKTPPYNGQPWTIFSYDGDELLSIQTDSFPYQSTDYTYLFLDVNKDGLSDFIFTDGHDVTVYLNLSGFSFGQGRISRGILNDRKGISPSNLLYGSRMSSFIKTEGYLIKIFDFSVLSPESRALVSSEDSSSKITTNSYRFLPELSGYWAESASVDNSNGFVFRSLPIYVLASESKYVSPSSQTPYESLFHSFHNPVVHNLGLGFCGFFHIMERDYLSGPLRVRNLFFDPQRMGVLTSLDQRLSSISATPWSETSYTYDNHSTTHGKLSPRLTGTVSADSRTGIETKVSYGPYDDYDFPLQVITQKRLVPDTLTTYEILSRTYQHSTSPTKYILGVVTEESVIRERDGDATISWKERDTTAYDNLFRPVSRRHLVGAYNYATDTLALDLGTLDPTGLRARIRAARQARRESIRDIVDSLVLDVLDADSLVSETRWAYDAHGNVVSEKTAPYGADVFTGDTLVYDSQGRHLLSRTDALGRTTTFSGYDKFGNPASSTDHKGRTTSYTYDAWGRLVRTVRPDGTVERDTLAWGGAGLYTVTRTATGSPESVTHYDALGREVRSAIQRFNGQWQCIDKEYDARGRLRRVSLPYRGTAPSLWNIYAYDDYDRPVSITEASGKVSTWAYSGTSTTTVRDSVTSTSTINAMGDVVRMTDAGGTILYSLRDDGQPSSITAPGGVVTAFTYDGYGRRTAIVDPSAGTRTTQESWLADGSSVVASTNPNGSVTTHADRFGRTTLVERSGAHSTAYTYGSDGLLLSMISSNGADRVFTYDAYDRVATETDSVACFTGTRWIRKTFTYGAGSVVSSIKYTSPEGDITTETYTYANGHNTGITLPDSTPVWSLVSENDLGAPTQILSGQVTREYGYTVTGLPTYRKMGNPFNGGLGSLQHFTYQFNPRTGNLMSRTDVNHNQAESFAYDALDRLVSVNGRTVTYDNPTGNITAIGGVGTMTYGNAAHPYQMTGMTPVADSLISFGTQRITYTSFDRPATIKEGADSVTFRYGCSGERMTMEEIISLGFGELWNQTAYIGDRYECTWVSGDLFPGKEILYLGGDAYSAPMVYIKQGDGDWTLYNIGRDYLGSITQIATKTGLPVAEYSYDPWGRLRDPQTLSIYGRGHEPTLFLGRGFTGHEHLSQFGLINMNARLYDPLVGRFLSPDPFVQDADFSQNFNRYSYALNNPLKYTDESGEFFVLDSWLIGLIGGGVDRANQMAKNDLKIWGGLFNYDSSKDSLGSAFEVFSRFTWQLGQSFLGFLVAQLLNTFHLGGGVSQVDYLHGATTITIDRKPWGGITLGSYIFGGNDLKAQDTNSLFQHEYGHYLQSQEYGLFYLPFFGLSSLISSIVNDYLGHAAFFTEQNANGRSSRYLYSIHPGYEFNHYSQTGNDEMVWRYDSNPITGYNPKVYLDDQLIQRAFDRVFGLTTLRQSYSMYESFFPASKEQGYERDPDRIKIIF